MERSYDIYFQDTLCGTAWARTLDRGDAGEIRIECFLRFRDVPAIGLKMARKKSLHTLTADGHPRHVEIQGDNGDALEITVSDQTMNFGKGDIPLDRPVEFAMESNVIPLFAIWWEGIKGRETGTFRRLLCESGVLIDYELTMKDGNLVSSLEETFVLDGQGEIAEVRLKASDFSVRRGKSRFPKRTFTMPDGKPEYHAPTDILVEDTLIIEADKEVEATVARPLQGAVHAVAVFIGGTGIYGRHGFTPNIDIGTHQLLDDLARQGIASVRYEKFDRRVSNAVEADGAIDFDTLAGDAERWVNWLDGQSWADGLPRILIGHSMGGTLALAVAAGNPDIAACVLLNAPGRPLIEIIAQQIDWHQTHNPASDEAEAEARQLHQELLDALALDGEWTAENVDRRLLAVQHQRRFLKSVIHMDPTDFVPRSTCPLVVVQGTRDVQVSWEDACLLRDAAQAADRPVRLIEAHGLDHLLKRNKETGMGALAAYRDRRRRIPIAFIRDLAEAILPVVTVPPPPP